MCIIRALIRDEASLSHLMLLQCQPFKKYHEDYILHGFVECIESDDESLRRAVLLLVLDLIQTETLSPVNFGLAHKLLGFDRRMQLKEPGAFDETFSCFHSVLSVLRSPAEASTTEERTLCLKIILALTSVGSEVRSTVLRFLRTSYDLLAQYVHQRKEWMKGVIDEECLMEMSVFLKVLASEMKTTQGSELKFHSEQYIRLLIGDEGQERKFLDLVPPVVYSHSHPEMPSWEFFDPNELWKTITSCSEGTDINIKALHATLVSELKQASSQVSHAHTGITNEIKAIVSWAESRNASKDRLESKVQYFLGWRDLLETIILCNCLDFMGVGVKGLILLELIHSLTCLAMKNSLLPALFLPISSLTLISCSKLRHCLSSHVTCSHLLGVTTGMTRILDSGQCSQMWSQSQRTRVNYYASLLHMYSAIPASSAHQVVLSKRIVSKLSKDCLDGVELIKVLSLCILTKSDSSLWLQQLTQDGSLELLVKSLVEDDKEMKENRDHKTCKAFYSFESKMCLLTKTAASSDGAKILLHSGLIHVLSRLQTLDIHTFLLKDNEVASSVFMSVFRLLVTLCDSSPVTGREEVSKLLLVKSPILYAILMTPETYRSTCQGEGLLFYVSAFLSKMIPFMEEDLFKTFQSFLQSVKESLPEAGQGSESGKTCLKTLVSSPLFSQSFNVEDKKNL